MFVKISMVPSVHTLRIEFTKMEGKKHQEEGKPKEAKTYGNEGKIRKN